MDDDSLAVLLLTSRIGIKPDTDVGPLTLREWNQLSKKVSASMTEHPGELLHRTPQEIKTIFSVPDIDLDRIASLLQRIELVSAEVDQMASAGIRVLTRYEPGYPSRYLDRLGDSAPLVLFYAGEPALLGQPGVAVVGSRNVDEAAQGCAAFIGNSCGLAGMVLYSGGARGVDSISMQSALDVRGCAVGVLSDSLVKTAQNAHLRTWLKRGDLCLVSPYSPDAGFSVGSAMGRNRLIYCLADYAIVVASEAEKGGTWAGAQEALKADWVPVFALDSDSISGGNRLLIQKGASPFPYPFPEPLNRLSEWLAEHSRKQKSSSEQPALF